jgi:hypothetical protein
VVPAHVIAAGMPAKVMRENIEWRRDFTPGGAETAGAVSPRPRKKRWGLF